MRFERHQIFVGNQWVDPTETGYLEVHSPITEELVGRVPRVGTRDVDRAVAAARDAFDNGPWRSLTVEERGAFLVRAAELLEPRIDELVDLQVDEMGGPTAYHRMATTRLIQGVAAQVHSHASFAFRDVRDGGAGKVLVLKEPVGVVGTIIPWNAPVPSILNKIVTPLLFGCTVVIKPAEETPLSAYLVAEAFGRAGLPAGTLSILPAGRDAGEHLVRHPQCDLISFTGSAAVGAQVGARCGEQIKPVILELGGKSAAIILEDVDLEEHIGSIVAGGLPNNGQICFATTRILAPRSRYDEVVDRLAREISSLEVGDPHDPEVAVGPLVSSRQRDRVENYIRRGVEEGARIVTGGARPSARERGWYVEPTLFADVDNAMTIAQDEIFGPVLVAIPYDDEDHAVAIANDSIYGLGGAVYSRDLHRALGVAARIQTGTCSVNGSPPGGGGAPFGGYKKSGLGREHGDEGRASYLEIKTITLPAGVDPDEI